MVRKIESLASESTTLHAYLREIATFPQLTPDAEQSLGRQFQQHGDEGALDRLVAANLRFVVGFASRFRGLGVPQLELIHAGNRGLMEAARRFNPGEPGTLRARALWWVRQAVIHALVHPASAETASPAAPFGTGASARHAAALRVAFETSSSLPLAAAEEEGDDAGRGRPARARRRHAREVQDLLSSARQCAVLHGHLN